MAKQASGRLAEHSCADQILVEEMIAGNPDGCQFAAVTGINGVNHPQTVAVIYHFLAYADGCGEEAERLEMVLEIAAPLVQQVVVDGTFLINGYQLAQLA